MKDGVKILKQIEIFSALDDKELEKLNLISEEVTFKTEDKIIEQGKSNEYLYIIKKGGLRVVRNHILLAVLTGNVIVGELSLLDGGPASATVTAVEDTVMVRISFADIKRLMEEESDISLKIYKAFSTTLCSRLRDANEWLAMCHRDWLSELSRSLKEHPHI